MARALVFSQSADTSIPVAALAGQAKARFAAEVTMLDAGADPTSIRLEVAASGARGIFVLRARPVAPADLDRARDAEQRGRAAGMADLAARCSTVWSVEGEPGTAEWLLFEFCAVLAFAALGPVLPADGSTLFGVRGARERADRLRGSS